MYFGAKAHIGVDSQEECSAFGVHLGGERYTTNICCPTLLHGGEKKVWGDAGYQGQTEAIHKAAPKAQDMT